MANAKEPGIDELVWTIAVARIIFGKDMDENIFKNEPEIQKHGCQNVNVGRGSVLTKYEPVASHGDPIRVQNDIILPSPCLNISNDTQL